MSLPFFSTRAQPSCSSNAPRPTPSPNLKTHTSSITPLGLPIPWRSDVPAAWSKRPIQQCYNRGTQGTHSSLDVPTSLVISYCPRSWLSRCRGRALSDIRIALMTLRTARIHHFESSYFVFHNTPSLGTRGRTNVNQQSPMKDDFERGRYTN